MPSKNNSSPTTTRKPYEPITELEHVQFALYEILELATRGKSEEIVPLIQSVIHVTQRERASFASLPA